LRFASERGDEGDAQVSELDAALEEVESLYKPVKSPEAQAWAEARRIAQRAPSFWATSLGQATGEVAAAKEKAAKAAEEAQKARNNQWHSPRMRAIREKRAQAIAVARERGDRQAEAAALIALGDDLLNRGWRTEARGAVKRALALARQERCRRGLENAEQALAAVRDGADDIAEVLALLDHGSFLAALGQPAKATADFARAARLARTAANTRHSGAEWVHQRSLLSMFKALREAGLEEPALEHSGSSGRVDEQSGPAENRPTCITASNQADHVQAHTVVQVGVVHGAVHIPQVSVDGGVRITAEPAGHFENALNVSVTTFQNEERTYEYEGYRAHPDFKVRILVEAFTAQAVLLRRLRPVLVRELPRVSDIGESRSPYEGDYMRMPPREYRVDRADGYDADIRGQALRLDRAFAEGSDDFPFYVTASAPEHFVIWPELHGLLHPIEWRLELDWSCLGQHGSVAIEHGDRPFLSDGLRPSRIEIREIYSEYEY
jgi:tetratricopeptide (TPR) repeat protein